MSQEGELLELPEFDETGRPQIWIDAANMPQVVDRAEKILCDEDSGVYQRGDVVVGFVGDAELSAENGKYRLVALDDLGLAQRFNRVGKTLRRDGRTGEFKSCNFPPLCARTMLSERRHNFPQLLSVVETPLLLPNGELMCEPGYGRGHLLHFDKKEFPRESFLETPAGDDVDTAVNALDQLVSGFPCINEISKSAAISGLMTAVLRPGLAAAPMYSISAPAPGTGKTYLAHLYGRIATGRHTAQQTYPGDEIEFRKTLLGFFIGGDPILSIDNLNGLFQSDAMCSCLTSSTYQQRMLGANEIVTVPTRVMVCVNGCNLMVSGDLIRRTIFIYLDARVERPEARDFDLNPVEMLTQERAFYVMAVLTIVRAYMADRGYKSPLEPFGGFEEWSRMVREPLVWAGLEDPVASTKQAVEFDPEITKLREMLKAVLQIGAGADFDAAALIRTAQAHVIENEETALHRRELKAAVEQIAVRGGEWSAVALGKWLGRIEGRVVGGMRFVRKRGAARRGVGTAWCVELIQSSAQGRVDGLTT